MADNIFPRLEGGYGNIGPRQSGDVVTPGVPVVSLTITPARIEEDASAAVRVLVLLDNVPVPDATVTFTNTTPATAAAPASAVTNSSGLILFAMIGLAVGTTTVTASYDGSSSSAVVLTVELPEAPTEYDAQGAGVISVEGESALADALVAKTQRISHADQKAIFQADDIYMHVPQMTEKEIIFFRKSLPGPDEK